jgi:hypothetical protein
MPASIGKKQREGLIRRFASRLGFPKLFAALVVLFVLDLFFPDPIPFVDEAILGGLAVLVGMWRDRRETKRPPMKNVTPRASE